MSRNAPTPNQPKIPQAYAEEFDERRASSRSTKARPIKSVSAFLIGATICAVVVVAILTLGSPRPKRAFTAPQSTQQSDHLLAEMQLLEIWAAMEAYHDEHACYPPAYSTDVIGRPLHSWRTLILPHIPNLDAKSLSQRINYEKPWDDPENSVLLAESPGFPQNYKLQGNAIYLVRGLGWPLDGKTSPSRAELTKLRPPRIVLLRVSPQTINWMEPANGDRTEEKLKILEAVIRDQRPEISVHALLTDGSVVDLREIDLGTLSEITDPLD